MRSPCSRRAPYLCGLSCAASPGCSRAQLPSPPLTTARNSLTTHIEHALTVDPSTNKIPDRLAWLRVGIEEIKKVVKGDFAKINLVNGTSGFLAVQELKQGCKFHELGKDEFWTVEASIRGARAHGRLCTGGTQMRRRRSVDRPDHARRTPLGYRTHQADWATL